MKKKSLFAGRFALTGVAAAALCLAVSNASALGLGRLAVASALGENLRAEVDIVSLSPEEAANLRVTVAPPAAYRAAGVDYNPVLPSTRAVLLRRADGRPYLQLTSDRVVQEPFVDVILEISWSTGRLVREYTLLFDPPVVTRSSRTATAAAPVPAPARAAARPVPPPAATERAASPTPARSVQRQAGAVRTAVQAESRAAGPAEYRVRPGDSLSRIANRIQRPGVSLDQMLVALYRTNPDAFIERNMNLLKAGAVLKVPGDDAALAVEAEEAREVIRVQSADFNAYRQRLADGVAPARVAGNAQQASGTLQAAVEDRKQAAAPSADKLTLSKGTISPQASAPEDRASREREQQMAAARVAELSKNVDDLRKLKSETAVAGSGAADASGTMAVPVAGGAMAASAVAAAQTDPAAPTQALAPAAPDVAVAAAPPVAAASETSADLAAAADPSPAAPASAVAAAPAASAAPAPAPVGGIGSLLADNPLALAAGGALLALLAGFGIYRVSRRARRDTGETSFLESRLQPDSFFGASGGQRIDTRDTSGGSSSMSYSLSQLDAIGDVDPVAEADVYLAYGRDLQAEEILKEAMRSAPERMAIRTKLLEVYAKRRDTKGYELLASQLYALTRGEGEDWAKAQEMGAQIDSENPMYQPGGEPAFNPGHSGVPVEPLGASTMPQSVLPTASQFDSLDPAPPSVFDSAAMDLDLDLTAPAPLEAGAPRDADAYPVDAFSSSGPMSLDLPPGPIAAPMHDAGSSERDLPLEFDLSDISLDLDAPAPEQTPARADTGFGDIGLDAQDDTGADADPYARKLELAEEFRQIGDMEGARDLLQEVVAKSSGTLRTKAQRMLDELA